MGYILYTDRDTKFECRVELKGASLKEAKARLVVEADGLMLMFEGNISKNGDCVIPITKMNRFMDESTSGEMRLEVIADDAYFQPWKSSFTVDASRKLTVEVKNPSPGSNKPSATVRFVNDPMTKLSQRIIRELKTKGITIKNINRKRPMVVQCINEHVRKSGMKVDPAALINRVVKNMAQRRS